MSRGGAGSGGEATGFTEVADRVWVARHEWFDVNVTVVGGERGLVVVDTHASEAAARDVLDRVRRLGGPVVAVVNTHQHFDHTFGNAVFRDADPSVPLVATEAAAAGTPDAAERARALYAGGDDPHADEVLGTRVVPADTTFSSVHVLDLGDRIAELVHPGRGHTDGDLVVRVPDAGAVLAGDLVEESAPPAFGPDCWPMDWPATLDFVIGLVGPADVVVPGHGAVVDRAFVDDQRIDVGNVAEAIRHLATSGVPVDRALAEGDWPYPAEHLADAVRRGYAQLPRGDRRLPMA